jgi:hypothetical protein
MAETRALIKTVLPDALGDIVIEYFEPLVFTYKRAARLGCYELCEDAEGEDMDDVSMGAAKGGHLEIVKMASPYVSDNYAPELGSAWLYGYDDIAAFALTKNIGDWCRPLRRACRLGNRALIEQALSHFQDPSEAYPDALYGALHGGHVELVKEILPNADRHAKDFLYAAIASGNTYLVGIAIKDLGSNPKMGAYTAGKYKDDTMIRYLHTVHGVKGHDWDPGMTSACEAGRLDNIRLLRSFGAIPSTHSVVSKGRLDIIELLLEYKLMDINDCLKEACACGSMKIAKRMIALGAEPTRELVTIALNRRRYDLVRMIIDILDANHQAKKQALRSERRAARASDAPTIIHAKQATPE